MQTQLESSATHDLLHTMWQIRHFENRVGELKRKTQVHGMIHLSIGAEGVAAAVCRQLRNDDVVYSGHRAHGHAIAKGAPLTRVMAELMGREDGLCRGLGGSMHLVDVEHGLFGATGVVGGNLPLAVGSALAQRLEDSGQVTVVFFGDGAVQAGHFAESVNLASLWELPVIFVCENNGVAEFTTREEHTRVERVVDAVAPYGFDTEVVDGGDVPAVWDAFGRFLEGARTGRGPYLLECLTHRRRGHYEGDPEAYRAALNDDDWREQDPIVRLQEHATAQGWLEEKAAAELEVRARAEVEEAVQFASDSPYPQTSLTAELVYAVSEVAR